VKRQIGAEAAVARKRLKVEIACRCAGRSPLRQCEDFVKLSKIPASKHLIVDAAHRIGDIVSEAKTAMEKLSGQLLVGALISSEMTVYS
jgi:hypothetical protein